MAIADRCYLEPHLRGTLAKLFGPHPTRRGPGALALVLLAAFGLAACSEAPPTEPISLTPQFSHTSGNLPDGDRSVTVPVKDPGGDPVPDVSVVLYNNTGFQRALTNWNGEVVFAVNDGNYAIAVLPTEERPHFIAPAHGQGAEEGPVLSPVVTNSNLQSVLLTATTLLQSLASPPVVVEFHPSHVHDRSHVTVPMTLLEGNEFQVGTPPGATVWAAITGLSRSDIPAALRPNDTDPNIPIGVVIGGFTANSSTSFSVPQHAEVAFKLLQEGPTGWVWASGKKAAGSAVANLELDVAPLVCSVSSSGEDEKGDNTGNIDLWKVFWGFLGDIDPAGTIKPPDSPQPASWVDLVVTGSGTLKHDTRIERNSGGNLSASVEWNCTTTSCVFKKLNASAGLSVAHSATKLSNGMIRATVWIEGIDPDNFQRASFGWSVPGDQYPNAARANTVSSLQTYGDFASVQCSVNDLGNPRIGNIW